MKTYDVLLNIDSNTGDFIDVTGAERLTNEPGMKLLEVSSIRRTDANDDDVQMQILIAHDVFWTIRPPNKRSGTTTLQHHQ